MRFDVLEDIAKARKAKGLANWKKLEHLQEKLQGKQASHITFTTSYPGQEGSKKHLGSASGNMHFLLGYVNPGFHVAPYHWQLVDPNLTDEEASKKKHPANPRYWKEADLEIVDEGDFDAGKPHPHASSDKRAAARTAERKTGAVTTKSGYGTYVGVPDEGLVYSQTNGSVYKWGIVRESYLASTNPEFTEKMDGPYEEGPQETEKGLDGRVNFDHDVYPLVRKYLPVPGSTFPVEDFTALVKSDRIEFYTRDGSPVDIELFDRSYRYFDILKGGDIHPSLLLRFCEKYLDVDSTSLEQYVHIDEAME